MNTIEKPYLLCEVANVHGGDSKYLEELVQEYGTLPYERKGIKFQVFKYDRIALPDFEWFPVYQELYFEAAHWKKYILEARQFGDVWIDIFDTYGVEVLSENIDLVHGVKLQASILQNKEVFDELLKVDMSDKKLMINVSGFGLDDVAGFIDQFSHVCSELIVQIGYQRYPTAISDTGLQKIPVLKAAFPHLRFCMADHADATTDFALKAPVYGVLLGCSYVEKHMCLTRERSRYDKYSALELGQMVELCQALDELVTSMAGRFVQQAEEDYLAGTVQIPVLKNGMESGALLAPGDFLYRRTSQAGVDASTLKKIQEKRYVLAKAKTQYETITEDDYKPARVAAVVACRMKSTRLPQKAIIPIAGQSSVERCLVQCGGIKGVDTVVLATSNLPGDDVLEGYTLEGQASLWRGDPDDVIDRYLGACEYYDVDVVVRVTADCPLVVPDILEYLLDKHFSSGADYTAANECAVGSSGEIINVSALRAVKEYFGSASYSEYMTWYFQNNKDFFKVNLVDLPEEYMRGYRMTLDYPEDLEMFEAFYANCQSDTGVKRAADIFCVLDEHPEIVNINSHLTLKYKTDQELIRTLNKETRMIRSRMED